MNFTQAIKGKTIIFGHTPTFNLHHNPTDYRVYFGENNIIGIDGGAVFGGQLHAFEWPSRQIVSVENKKQVTSKLVGFIFVIIINKA